MLNFIIRRSLATIPTLFGVIVVAFFLIHIIPGDPVDIMLGEKASLEDKANLRAQLGLDQALSTQFGAYLKSLLVHFDLGMSIQSRKPVTQELLTSFPATVELALGALLLATLIGIPLGILCAIKRHSFYDISFTFFSLLFMSMPGYWLGPMLIWIFAIHFGWFPVSDRGTLAHLFLPALSLALPLSAVQMRMTRAAMLETIREDYITTAKAKGLSRWRVYCKHALANALIPVITILSLQAGALLTGTVITEMIFDWPGLGTMLLNAIQQRNYTLVQGAVLFIALIYIVVNLLTDIIYGWVNPQIRVGGG